MTDSMRKQWDFLMGCSLLSVITVALVKIVRRQEPAAQNTSSDDSEAIRRGGLREAARIRGHYVGISATSYFLKYDLESLAAHSGNIIIGSPIDSTAHLSADGQLIMTWYRMKILEALKGKLLSDETVTIGLPGGKLTFED